MNGNILLQIEKATHESIAPGTPITFDTTVYSHGNISYEPGTDTVVLNQAGRYLVEWWAATQAGPSQQGAVFGISGNNISPSASIISTSPIKTGEIVGFAIIETTQTPASLILQNESGGEIWLSAAVPSKAVLRIHSHHELEYLDDGNTFGSLIGIGASRGYTMGNYAVALGLETVASGIYSYSEGYATKSLGTASHAQGGETHAEGIFSHAEGHQTSSLGEYSHAEGSNTQATAFAAHAEGIRTQAAGAFSHAEGSGTNASGNSSHAEGDATAASGSMSHAEGFQTQASEWASHAEGSNTQASGNSSHAEGFHTTASGAYSHSEGEFTSTNRHSGAHIMGRYGDADMDYSWFLANGIDESNKGLAAKIQTDGNAYIDVAWNSGGADYAEMFETTDGKTIQPGYFITLDAGRKIRIMNGSKDDYVLGISSATPSVLGNAAELRWQRKFKTDEWGRIEYHAVTIPAYKNKNGDILIPEHVENHPILNPEWNPDTKYVPRKKRPEWVPVGLLGQVLVRDDGTCVPGAYCKPDDNGMATGSPSGYRVLERINQNQILILFR